MASLTTDELADMRGDLGIGAVDATNATFTDAQLQRFYTRADESYAGAVVLAFRQILADQTLLHDYSSGLSSEKQSQVFDHVKAILEMWEGIAAGETADRGNAMRLVAVRGRSRGKTCPR
jgi:hypothetical protein